MTGKQGREVINRLLESPSSSDFTIYALTRNASTPSATALAKNASNIKIVQGNLDDPQAIFASIPTQVWGVFSVQQAIGGSATPETEERQGKALIDAALEKKVQFFVYTSVDRNGDEPTYVPHFISKHNVEKHLEEETENGKKMAYCVLRPVAFMENLTPDFQGKMFSPLMKSSMAPDRKLQLISTKDIGYFAAQAFMNPEKYKGRYITLAGDDLTLDQIKQIFKDTMGYPIPETFGFLAYPLKWMVKELGVMYRWFNETGYGCDIDALRKEWPGLLTFEEWLKKESNFPKK